MIVHSALGGVSIALDELLDLAVDENPQIRLDRIRRQHYELAQNLGLDGDTVLDHRMDELEQLIAGVRLVGEVSVRVRVRVMALGELMATELGAAYLRECGLPVNWTDARELLTSRSEPVRNPSRAYLAATCDHEPDPALQSALEDRGGIVLTQGFIARNDSGETVLLGRGGSDTSAAYLAARLQARRLEIWTDVPGMFTADPRVVPSARLIVALHYDEAQELASAGSSVMHPRSISATRGSRIPIFVRSTANPEIGGTVISSVTDEIEPQVKGICLRHGLTLVSMTTVGMWHEVGFLARAFAVFADHGVSVDLVSTSETNVTVSVDTKDGMLPDTVEESLVRGLEQLCRVSVISNCAAISLVGRKIRKILPRLAPALEVFDEEPIHLMSQSANDLNLSFVVDQQQGAKLVGKLHASIIPRVGSGNVFGPSWERLFAGDTPSARAADTDAEVSRQLFLEVLAPVTEAAESVSATGIAVRGVPRAVAAIPSAVAGWSAVRLPKAARTSLVRPVSGRLRVAAARIGLVDLHDAAQVHGATVNDAVLTAVAGAVGAVLAGVPIFLPRLK